MINISELCSGSAEVFAILPGEFNGELGEFNLADADPLLSELMLGELKLLELEELDPNKAPNVLDGRGGMEIEFDFFFLSVRFSLLSIGLGTDPLRGVDIILFSLFSISFGTDPLRDVVIIFFHEIMSRAILMRIFEFNKKKLNNFEKIW